jgi:hypothetical protein
MAVVFNADEIFEMAIRIKTIERLFIEKPRVAVRYQKSKISGKSCQHGRSAQENIH